MRGLEGAPSCPAPPTALLSSLAVGPSGLCAHFLCQESPSQIAIRFPVTPTRDELSAILAHPNTLNGAVVPLAYLVLISPAGFLTALYS